MSCLFSLIVCPMPVCFKHSPKFFSCWFLYVSSLPFCELHTALFYSIHAQLASEKEQSLSFRYFACFNEKPTSRSETPSNPIFRQYFRNAENSWPLSLKFRREVGLHLFDYPNAKSFPYIMQEKLTYNWNYMFLT